MEYEVFFESEEGLVVDYIQANNKREMMKILCEKYPEDIGSDGFFNCPKTENEVGLDW